MQFPGPLGSSDLHEIRILNPSVQKLLDLFRILLVSRAQKTLMPELLDIFGQERVARLIDVFGGMKIEIPDRSFLERLVRDADIYSSLVKGWNKEMVKVLATRYDITDVRVRQIFDEVEAIVREVSPCPTRSM